MVVRASARVVMLVVFLWEYLAWNLDTAFTHTHMQLLEHEMTRNEYFLTWQVNALPHLFAFFAFARNHRDSVLIKGYKVLYFVFLTVFCGAQFYIWWLPYFFGCCGHQYASTTALHRWIQMHDGDLTILPRFSGRPVMPDTEHTLLMPLSLLALALTFYVAFHDIHPRPKKA